MSADLIAVTGATGAVGSRVGEEAYASRAGCGAADWDVRGWVTAYQAIRDGSLARVSPCVRELTGQEPTSLAGYLRETWMP